MTEYFSGRVHSVVYENVPQAFYVLRMRLDSATEIISVRGYVPGFQIRVGSWFGFEGAWKDHPKYGNQVEIERAPVIRDWNADTVQQILTANGVGEMLVTLVRKHFGDADFVKAVQDETMLVQVNGISPFAAKHIVAKWEFARATFRAIEFLNSINIPKSRIKQIWSVFGGDAEKVLSTDPWQLVAIDGFDFAQVDSIAVAMNIPLGNNPKRIKGAILHGSRSQKSMGHLYLSTGMILSYARGYIPEVTEQEVADALVALHKDQKIIIDSKTLPGTKAIYEPWFYRVESDSADLLKKRADRAGTGDQDDFISKLAGVGKKTAKAAKTGDVEKTVNAAIAEWAVLCRITLDPKQREGIHNALTAPVSIITGLPGTGKTTSLKVLVKILQTIGMPHLLIAPTGIAAKRLAAATGSKASTIHRAFAAKLDEDTMEVREATYEGIVGDSQLVVGVDDGVWGYDSKNPHPAQFIIADEASMIDQSLLYRILTCTLDTSKILLVGDAAQLPSVGPGNVLRDMIASRVFPVVSLTDIYRQEDTSGIVLAAHDIFNGKVPVPKPQSDFTLVPVADENAVLTTIVKIAQKLQAGQKDFQILSPRHSGVVGVTSLNRELREVLNPPRIGGTEVKIGTGKIRLGDRIMVVKNNYKLKVFNGDIGNVIRIDLKAQDIEIELEDQSSTIVRFTFQDAAGYIRLAYACSVHKAQGHEYDTVMMPLVASFQSQLQRNLLYTAITRAKKKVILVGTQEALEKAVANNREDERNTLFAPRLREIFSSPQNP